jgi:hypothetical protein
MKAFFEPRTLISSSRTHQGVRQWNIRCLARDGQGFGRRPRANAPALSPRAMIRKTPHLSAIFRDTHPFMRTSSKATPPAARVMRMASARPRAAK